MQLGCHPVAVVILHVHKYDKVARKFKSGGLHERHVVTTWKLGNHPSIRLWTQGNQEKPVSAENRSGYIWSRNRSCYRCVKLLSNATV